MVLKRLLSLLKDGILLGQVRYYVEQSHFHSANGGYETPSVLSSAPFLTSPQMTRGRVAPILVADGALALCAHRRARR